MSLKEDLQKIPWSSEWFGAWIPASSRVCVREIWWFNIAGHFAAFRDLKFFSELKTGYFGYRIDDIFWICARSLLAKISSL